MPALHTRLRRVVATAVSTLVTATGLAMVPFSAPAHAAGVTLTAEEVGEALFVAGDAARLETEPMAPVLERVLQQMYALRPGLDPDRAVAEMQSLETAILAPSTSSTQGEVTVAGLFRVDYLACTLGDDSERRQQLCDQFGSSEAINKARVWAAAQAARREAESALMKRAAALAAEEAAMASTPMDQGLSSMSMDPLHDWMPANAVEFYDAGAVLRDTYGMAQDSDAFREARDKYLGHKTQQTLTSTNQERIASDPDLAAVQDMVAKMALDGSLALTTTEAETAVDTALTGPRGGSEVTQWALTAFDAFEAAQKLKDKAVTKEQKEAAEKAFTKAQADMKQPLEDAKKFVAGAKTVVQFANFFIEKFDPALAESIEETADVVFNVAESVIGIGMNIVSGVANFYSGNWIGLVGDAFSALSGLEKLFAGESASKPKPDPVMKALQALAANLEALQSTMNERFDRIDEMLNQIYSTMTQGMTEILVKLETNNTNVMAVFDSLQSARADLVRLESTILTLFADEQRRALNLKVTEAVGKESMTQGAYEDAAAFFVNWALRNARDAIVLGGERSFQDEHLLQELGKGLASNVEFLRVYPQVRWGMAPLGSAAIPNPNEWAYAARAYQRLVLEHPQHFRSESRNARWLAELTSVGETLRETMVAVGEPDATDDTGAPLGTGNRVLNRALASYRTRWETVTTGIRRITDTVNATKAYDIFGGAHQAPTGLTPTALPASVCGAIVGKVPGGEWTRGIANPAGMSVLTGTTGFRTCIDASWVGERTSTSTGGKIRTTKHHAKLRTAVRLELVDKVDPGAGQVLAVAVGVRTGSEEVFCTESEWLDGDPTDPDSYWTDCDADSTQAPAVATRRWDSIAAGHTWGWAPLTSSADAELQRDVNAVLKRDLALAYSYVVNALRPYRTVVVGGQTVTLSHGAELEVAVRDLNAARELLASYVELGLPQELATDAQLRMLLRGGVMDGEQAGVNDFFALTEGSGRLPDQVVGSPDQPGHLDWVFAVAADDLAPGSDARALVEATVTQRIAEVEQALRAHVTDPAPGSLSSMAVDSTLVGLWLASEALEGGGPVAEVTGGPSGTTTAVRPTFRFSAGEQAAYECRVVAVGAAAPGFGACSTATSHTPAALPNGDYRFDVRSIDRSRNVGPVASRTFRVTGSSVVGGPTAFTMVRRPVVKGKARVGRRLRATTGSWSPTPASYRYQWFRGKKRIKGATRAAYRLTRKDRGTKITVRVTVVRRGVTTRSVKAKAVRVR